MKKVKMETIKNYATLFSMIFGTLSASFIGFGTLKISAQASKISSQQAVMNDFYRPLLYTITSIPSNYIYEFFDPETGITVSLPAYSKEISAIQGGIRELTVLCYDEYSGLCENESLALSPDGKTITIDVPPNSTPLIVGDIYYEYYFLLIESTDNEWNIDMVCTEISLSKGQINTEYRWKETKLLDLSLNKNITPAQSQMLNDYNTIRNEIINLLGPTFSNEESY